MTVPDAGARISFRRVLTYILLAFIVILPVRVFVAQPFLVSGGSMTPTFSSGDYLVVDELSYRFHPSERGDIIIFRYPLDPDQVFIKRIIALPGERVQVKQGHVYVFNAEHPDGMQLTEPYIQNQSETLGSPSPVTLGTGEYFVLGDNRTGSSDSRTWGILPEDDIVGRAFVTVFPLSRAAIHRPVSYPDTAPSNP
jgi:signal peptidase I